MTAIRAIATTAASAATVVVAVPTAATVVAVPTAALASTATGADYGQHVRVCAQTMGFTANTTPNAPGLLRLGRHDLPGLR
jgi:hypothetical protein